MFPVSSYSCQSIEARCEVENEDVVGAAPAGDAPTTSEWSTILLPTNVRFILEVWRKLKLHATTCYISIVYYDIHFPMVHLITSSTNELCYCQNDHRILIFPSQNIPSLVDPPQYKTVAFTNPTLCQRSTPSILDFYAVSPRNIPKHGSLEAGTACIYSTEIYRCHSIVVRGVC